jgi:hypothetical protein
MGRHVSHARRLTDGMGRGRGADLPGRRMPLRRKCAVSTTHES